MTSSGPICFWSYTHRDDDLEGGRIRRLANSISNEYELMTGESLEMFVDNTAIAWGQRWRSVIDDALTRTAFFIPVITPLYLRSNECRREFLEFSGKARNLGSIDLLLPILYSDTPAVSDSSNDDEIVRLVRDIQRSDWRQLRLADESSEKYRTAVHELAARLVEVMAAESARPLPDPPTDDIEDEPGFLDDVAQAEESAESWQAILSDLSQEIQTVEAIVADATTRLKESDLRGGGARGRLVVVRRFSDEIEEPSRRINKLGKEFVRSVVAADPGVRELIQRSKTEALTSSGREQADSFLQIVGNLAESSEMMANGTKEFLVALDGSVGLSRVLRPPIGRLRSGISAVNDAHAVFSEWSRLARGAD